MADFLRKFKKKGKDLTKKKSSKDQAIHQQQAKARRALEKNEAKGGADNYSDRLGRRERREDR